MSSSSTEKYPRNRSLSKLRRPPSPRNRSLSKPRRSPSPRRGIPAATPRKFPLLSEQIDTLPKCSSEPTLPGTSGSSDGSPRSVSKGWLYRPTTLFSSSDSLLSPHEGYEKDTKVVVTVTVEGSPGPVRTMAKLGASVEEIIKVVVDKYKREGRTPKLDENGGSVCDDYELHLSYFSLESLDRSDEIGDIGSRNFYLRRASFDESRSTVSAQTNTRQRSPLMVFLPAQITRKFAKVARRMRRLWKVLCLQCS